ncbi:MAG: glycosyltransferase family 39 protein [Chloroflexi bacterium]|nr:glycosyltransferase family 39 protein [Chloroflexota bacterium]
MSDMKKTNEQQEKKPYQFEDQNQVQPQGGQEEGGEATVPIQSRAPQEQPGEQQQQQKPEDQSGSYTLLRMPNFFVHGFRHAAGGEGDRKKSDSLIERLRWDSLEKERLMAEQTRLLPEEARVSTQRSEMIPPLLLEFLLIALVLGIALAVQAWNLFNYPAYTTEEGQYMANAWAVLHGQLEPYTYIYDHPPVGWFQIAVWWLLTGGPANFGNAINVGRVLLLELTLASSILLYLVTKRLSGSWSAAFLALTIYSLSPLSLAYHREVLLDSIATFWLLLSLWLIIAAKSDLRSFVLAAVALGIAILSKENFILFIPALLYGVWLCATPFQRKFSVITFLYFTLAIVLGYVLFAALKGELFPPGVLPWDREQHPSLIGSLADQWQMPLVGGQFSDSWNTWMQSDKLLFAGGSIAMFINLLGGIYNRFRLLAALLAASCWIFLLGNNVVYPYNIVPLLPFLALNIVLALSILRLQWLSMKRGAGIDLAWMLLCFVLVIGFVVTDMPRTAPLLTRNDAEPQRQAIQWIRSNVQPSAVVIINPYMYSDLHEPEGKGVGSGASFVHAQIYTNAALDPAIYNKELKGDWRNINYLAIDALMQKEISTGQQYVLLNRALHHAILKATFGSIRDGTQIRIFQVMQS